MAKNDQKLNFQVSDGGMERVIVWSSSLSIDIIATAPSDNSFVNKSGGGIKGSPMSRLKWWKMAKNDQKFNFQANGGKMG